MQTRYAIQLRDSELITLGKIAYLWSVVDDLMARNSLWCSEFYKTPLGPGFKNSNFNARREAWKSLVLAVKDIPDAHRKRVLSIDGRICRAEQTRKELMHGVAFRGHKGHDLQFIRELPPKKVEHKTDIAELDAFADELSLIGGELVEMMSLWAH